MHRKLVACACASLIIPTVSLNANAHEDRNDGRIETKIVKSGESILVEDKENWETILIEGNDGPKVSSFFRSANTPAPACVKAKREGAAIQVYNECDFDVRVKVVMAFSLDSECRDVVHGTRHNIYTGAGRIDRVELC